ncbi:secreted protein [methanotrophic bacterial endosymbiont of Bathymodiolus sp.]|nr:secreted protein [methanotrophic bacterial endosymbiont of Bathymodiolus sp.]
MHPIFLFLSTVSAFLAVAMGAFGAHALKAILSPEMLMCIKQP